jgi:hypothetical protein
MFRSSACAAPRKGRRLGAVLNAPWRALEERPQFGALFFAPTRFLISPVSKGIVMALITCPECGRQGSHHRPRTCPKPYRSRPQEQGGSDAQTSVNIGRLVLARPEAGTSRAAGGNWVVPRRMPSRLSVARPKLSLASSEMRNLTAAPLTGIPAGYASRLRGQSSTVVRCLRCQQHAPT